MTPVDEERDETTTTPRLARVVVTGVGADGRSTITSDGPTSTWVRRPTGALVMDLWRIDDLPVSVDADSTAPDEVVLRPGDHGVVVRISVVPPDNAIDADAAAAYAAALGEIYGGEDNAASADEIPGMHVTETVDIMTVLDGEIWSILEDGETLLRTGDSMIQRGTRHAWRNRTERPVTVVTTMVPAVRAAQTSRSTNAHDRPSAPTGTAGDVTGSPA